MTVRRKPLATIALAIGVALALVPSASMALADDAVPGIFIDSTVHELPAPAVALASDGRALVVYQDNEPDAAADFDCTASDDCVTYGVVVGADGITVGEPFVVSGDVPFDYYYTAPQVMWNDDLGEWLVLMTSYRSDPNSLFAQRVGSDGELVGALVELPSQTLTSPDDRSTLIETSMSNHVLPNATWSPALDAYLVTWYADGNTVGSRVAVGYFMNADLTSYDDVEAGFQLAPVTGVNYSIRQDFNAETGEWAVAYSMSTGKDVFVMGVRFDGTTLDLSTPMEVVDGGTVQGMWPQGGLTYVASQGAWLVSFGGEQGTSPDQTYDVYGRYVSDDLFGAPAVSESIAMTSHGTSSQGNPIQEGRSHEIKYDSVTGLVYGAGTVVSYDADIDRDVFAATAWSFDPATDTFSDVVELFAPSGGTPPVGQAEQSSRARISVQSGGVAVTWQNWLGGDYQEPTEVRFALLQEVVVEEEAPELAETGAAQSAGIAGVALALMVAGGALIVARRRQQATT